MGFVVELTDPEEHPGRINATECAECGQRAVMFNPYNVGVNCHACGSLEVGGEKRQAHFRVWLEHAVSKDVAEAYAASCW